MATPPAKIREGFECPLCLAALRPGSAVCKACGNPVPRSPETLAVLVFLGMLAGLILLLVFTFVALPNMKGNSAISLVRTKDKEFVDRAVETIQTRQYRFIGWDTQVYGSRLVLVTFTYQDPVAGQTGYMAVWWAVDLDTGSVHRVTSMQDFADNYLLKIG